MPGQIPMAETPTRRPRIEGAREREIFDATVELLAEIGYDRLTLDAVAGRAKASKATIYRLWGDKSALVSAAIEGQHTGDPALPDTGALTDDLLALAAMRGFFDTDRAAIISGLATAIHRDPERLDAVRRRLVDDGTKHVRALLTRAVQRGELSAGVDVELMSSVIPAMVLFRMTYQTVGTFTSAFIEDVVATIVAPALQHQSTNGGKDHHESPTRR